MFKYNDLWRRMDLGLLLYRDYDYDQDTDEAGIMEIIVGKNRNGFTGTCRVEFDHSIGRFANLKKFKRHFSLY